MILLEKLRTGLIARFFVANILCNDVAKINYDRIANCSTFVWQKQISMTKAIAYFTNGTSSIVRVNSSYSKGGIHFYNLTLNALKTFLDWAPGETALYSQEDVSKLTYIMG